MLTPPPCFRIAPVSIHFHIDATHGPARLGRLITPHAVVETPVFMPVGTVGTVKGIPQDLLEELGVDILLGNTYHLYLRPGVETVRHMGGLVKLHPKLGRDSLNVVESHWRPQTAGHVGGCLGRLVFGINSGLEPPLL